MLRLMVKLALAAAVVAAVWAFVPFGGRTLAERWHRAHSASEFAERTWAELRGAPAPSHEPAAAGPHEPSRRGPAAPGARLQREAQSTAPSRKRPAETHSEADRRALDRLLSDELEQHPSR